MFLLRHIAAVALAALLLPLAPATRAAESKAKAVPAQATVVLNVSGMT